MNTLIFFVALGCAWYFFGHALGALGFASAVTFMAVKLRLQERFMGRRDRVLADVSGHLNQATEELRKQSSQGDAGAASGGMFDVPELMRLGKWDEARRAMQKLAFGIAKQSPEVQAQFKKLAVQFAAVDPFYNREIGFVLNVVRQGQPIRQAEIYEFLSELSKDDVRYVLYFAEQLGQVIRIKKGNSYILTLPAAKVS